MDSLALIETWLTSSAKDSRIIRRQAVPRKGNKVDGSVAILHKAKSFEYFGSRSMHVCFAYMPHPSTMNTLATFEEFSPFLQDHSCSSADFIKVGDTNFHLDKPSDHDVNIFLQLFDIFYFRQRLASFSHCSGHILDVVITKNNQDIVQDTIVKPQTPTTFVWPSPSGSVV